MMPGLVQRTYREDSDGTRDTFGQGTPEAREYHDMQVILSHYFSADLELLR